MNQDRAGASTDRFAIADGASDSARAEVWAEILVEAYVREHIEPWDTAELPRLRHRWRDEVHRPTLPWHSKQKLNLGGATTFLGVRLAPDHACYDVTAIGDSCLFHFRREQLVAAGPVDGHGRFGRKPCTIRSRFDDPDVFRKSLWRFTIPYQRGDVLILATDALSKYLLRAHEQDRKVDMAEHLATEESFTRWVVDARAHDGLDNDDTTICVVRL
ncbi:protein phosphatase 2C domain-containing protein [Nocardia macrotermitis]|uniref:protein phosphatase 2C domain-containing protein n=1 Tax=Nocardia macrotermitis TaxID=2585198 RepID=UPI0018863AAF|nr:protein phosphatase 2C domain-containing protein [Nocardia macrotermitis]